MHAVCTDVPWNALCQQRRIDNQQKKHRSLLFSIDCLEENQFAGCILNFYLIMHVRSFYTIDCGSR